MNRIRKGDKVVVISGKHKGESGEVIEVLPTDDRVVVRGLNIVTKAVKRSQQNPTGGLVKREAPIHASNVMLADPVDGKPTRVRFNTTESGQKVRVAAKSGEQIDK